MTQRVAFDHRRADDGEHVGYLEMDDAGGFIPFDLLHRQRGGPMELPEAEAVLDEIGLRLLAEGWELDTDEGWLPVRIVELDRDCVVVSPALATATSPHVAKTVDLTQRITLPLPTERLRPREDERQDRG